LGAGASAPFGYPLGAQLIENIIEGLKRLPRDIEYDLVSASPNALSGLATNPYLTLAHYVLSEQPKDIPSEFYQGLGSWRDLANELQNTSHQSIDDYARVNPSKRAMIKLLIALEMGRHSFEPSELKSHKLRPANRFSANSRATWYGKLVHKIRDRCVNSRQCEENNNLTILTFNYDRSLEMYLEQELHRGELYRDLDWKKVVGIVHVHGELQIMQSMKADFPMTYMSSLIQSAKSFKMIDDERDTQDPAMVGRYALNKANDIIVIGFDFHPQNMQLLELADKTNAKKMKVLNYTGGLGFTKRVLSMGATDENVWRKASANYEISNAIDDGILDGYS
jgi:hypothetical protein